MVGESALVLGNGWFRTLRSAWSILLLSLFPGSATGFFFVSPSARTNKPNSSTRSVLVEKQTGSLAAGERATASSSSSSSRCALPPLESSTGTGNNKSTRRKLYSFEEARKIARGHGFSSAQEFLEYECPGAYQLPKNPDEVWRDEWKGWDDWLGLPWDFERGRQLARSLGLATRDEYLLVVETKEWPPHGSSGPEDDCDRLPYRPDLYYKGGGWVDWDNWLGVSS